jgi:hypothetical protein
MTPTTTGVERSLGPSSIEIKRFLWKDCPPELVELRRLVWKEETGLLPEEGLFNDNDQQGVHILVYDRANNNHLIASTCAVEAERSDFAVYTRLPENVLSTARHD